ncbi:MAG: histidine phosphatase family protein [Parvularculaceae bacterium]
MEQTRSQGFRGGRRRVFLMRHGHVDYFDPALARGADPRLVRLTEEGRAQARAAASALAEADFDAAFCSGLPRTRETAECILAGRDPAPPLEDAPGLEELKSGAFYTARKMEFAARLRFSLEAAGEPGATFLEGGEVFADAYARATEAFERILIGGSWKTALVVAHEGINRMLLAWACDGGLKSMKAFEQDLGCINVLDVDLVPAMVGGGLEIERVIVKSVNVTPYDYLKHGMPLTSIETLFAE